MKLPRRYFSKIKGSGRPNTMEKMNSTFPASIWMYFECRSSLAIPIISRLKNSYSQNNLSCSQKARTQNQCTKTSKHKTHSIYYTVIKLQWNLLTLNSVSSNKNVQSRQVFKSIQVEGESKESTAPGENWAGK